MVICSYDHMTMVHHDSYLVFLRIFSRTDLRIGQSEAKFDAEADFELRSAVAPQKPDQIDEKLFFRSQKFPKKKILRFARKCILIFFEGGDDSKFW